MQTSDYASIAAFGGIFLYDLLAPPGQTISEAFDRYLTDHRWSTELVVLIVYLHLANKVPDYCDPIHWVFDAVKAAKRLV